MKYLKYRNNYLSVKKSFTSEQILNNYQSSEMIREVLENDITWGGSLLGRFINSTIRLTKIHLKKVGIETLIKELQQALDDLLIEAITPKDIKNEFTEVKSRFFLEEIFKTSVNTKITQKEKLDTLLGTTNTQGQIDMVLNALNEVEEENSNIKNKKYLIERLEKYKSFLEKLKSELDKSEDKEEEEEVSKEISTIPKTNEDIYKWTISLLNSTLSLISLAESQPKQTTSTTNQQKLVLQAGKVYKTKEGKICKLIKVKGNFAFVNYAQLKDNKFVGNFNPYPDTIDKNEIVSEYTIKETKPQPAIKQNDSYFFENEMLPIFEDENTTKSVSKKIKLTNPWKKIISAIQKSGIIQMKSRISELIKKSNTSEGNIEKKWILTIAKQIVENENTVGKNKLNFESLMKEAQVPTSYNDIPKAISLISNAIMGLEGHEDEISKIGPASYAISTFISAFNSLKKYVPKMVNKKSPLEPQKEKLLIKDFSGFILLKESDEDNEQSDDNKIEKSEDKILNYYNDNFAGEIADDYKIDVRQVKELQSKIEEAEKSEVEPDPKKKENYDRIIRIVNIFGKAWKKYATDYIQSGRPDGRISQKTFRQYEYLGSGTPPNWTSSAGPGYGPWGAKTTLDVWDKGVMEILEDPKYRTVLANVKFKSPAEIETKQEGKKPTGKNLFTFINDLLGHGKDKNFKEKRRRLLGLYFGIEETTTPEKESSKVKQESKYPLNEFFFLEGDKCDRKLSNIRSFQKDYLREFMRIKVNIKNISDDSIKISGETNLNCFLMDYKEVGDKKYVVMKFQIGPQSIFQTYLHKQIESDGIEKITPLPNSKEEIKAIPGKPVYLTAIDITNGFKLPTTNQIKFISMKDIDSSDQKSKINTLTLKDKPEAYRWLCGVIDNKLSVIKSPIDVDDLKKPTGDVWISLKDISNELIKKLTS